MGSELAKAKLKVMASVPYIQKERKPGLNYSFAGEAAIIEKLHPAFREAGLVWAVTGCEVVASEQYSTKSGASMNRVMVKATYSLTHAESGQAEQIQAVGEGADSGDKATSKAMTSALKYALRQTFLIETGDDPDHTPSEHQERGQRQQPARPQPPAQRPSPADLRELLTSRGWGWTQAIHAINGAEGANYLEGDLPDAVLTDHLARFCDHLRAQPAKQAAGGK
jgi:hypothetical protein